MTEGGRRRCCLGWRGWIPVFTGMTEGDGNDGGGYGGGVAWGGGDWFPSSRE